MRTSSHYFWTACLGTFENLAQDAIDAHMEFLKDVLRGKSGWAEQGV